MPRPATVALAGGGTGGHVYPALAMGSALQARGHRIVYLGEAGRLEGRVAPQRGVPFHEVPVARFPRSGVVARGRFPFALGSSVMETRRLLGQLEIDAVLGVGGYIMAPTVLAASSLGLPAAIHEANVTPGLANRLCARVADLVLLTYAATEEKLSTRGRVEVVGCPVDPKVLQGDRAAALARYGLSPDQPVLLVVGGSLGAARINEIGLAAARADRAWQLLFVTGPRYHDDVRAQLPQLPPATVLVSYEDRMADAYAVADLALCRAGSSTLAELTAVGLPSLLVPSPNVTDNHQEGNARGLEAVGAAEVFVEAGLDADAVVQRATVLLGDPDTLAAMGQAAREQAHLDAAERIADLFEDALLSA